MVFWRPSASKLSGAEPAFVSRLARRPFAVEHRKPGGVAIAALDDHVLAENALEREAEPLRGATRRRVEGVAFPFIAPITEVIEDIGRQEILSLGRARSALHRGRVHDAADLDDAIGRIDAHEAFIADRAAGRVVDDREIVRIGGLCLDLDIGGEIVEICERAVEQIVPHRLAICVPRRAFEQVFRMGRRVQRRQRDPPPLERDALRPLGRMSIDQWTDGPGCWRVRHTACRVTARERICRHINDCRAERPSSAPGAGNGLRV